MSWPFERQTLSFVLYAMVADKIITSDGDLLLNLFAPITGIHV
jgi:hypothetical protein